MEEVLFESIKWLSKLHPVLSHHNEFIFSLKTIISEEFKIQCKKIEFWFLKNQKLYLKIADNSLNRNNKDIYVEELVEQSYWKDNCGRE